MYKQANQHIMETLPAIPYAHTKPALAFRSDIEGFVPSPTTNELFNTVSIGGEASRQEYLALSRRT